MTKKAGPPIDLPIQCYFYPFKFYALHKCKYQKLQKLVKNFNFVKNLLLHPETTSFTLILIVFANLFVVILLILYIYKQKKICIKNNLLNFDPARTHIAVVFSHSLNVKIKAVVRKNLKTAFDLLFRVSVILEPCEKFN